MKKAIVLLAILAVFMAGCGADKTHKQEINLDNMDRKVEILPAIVGGAQTNWESIKQNEFPKSNIIEIAKIYKPFQKWQAESFGGFGELKKKWVLEFEHNESERPYRVTGMPNGWSVLSSHNYKGRFMVGVIDPATGSFTKKSYGQGITDGEYEFIDRSYGPNSAYCRRLSDDKKMWENLSSSWNAGEPEYFVINGALLYVGNGITNDINFKDNVVIYRVNPESGEIIWGIKSKPTSNNMIISHYAQCFSFDNYLWVLLNEISRASNNDDKYNSTYYLYRLDSVNGDVEKIELEERFEVELINVRSYGDNLYIDSGDGNLLVFNTKTNITKSFEIISSIERYNLPDNKVKLNNILYDKVYFKYWDSKNNKYSMFYSNVDNLTDIKPILIENSNEFDQFGIVNGSIFGVKDKKIIGLDPISLEPVWEINLENTDEHTELAWLDWRGVLVISGKEIACYAPK